MKQESGMFSVGFPSLFTVIKSTEYLYSYLLKSIHKGRNRVIIARNWHELSVYLLCLTDRRMIVSILALLPKPTCVLFP